MNAAASRLLARADGLTVERRELRAASAADTTRLRTCIERAANLGASRGAAGVVAVGRPSGRRALVVQVCSVVRRASWPTTDAAVATVVISDPDREVVADPDLLRQALGLTRAEADLARLLARGLSLAEAAHTLGLRRHTVRSRLKDIFGKTGTHRPAELVRLLLMYAGSRDAERP